LPLHDDLNLLLESTKELIPQTVQVIQKIQKDFEHGKLSASYLGLLMLPEINPDIITVGTHCCVYQNFR